MMGFAGRRRDPIRLIPALVLAVSLSGCGDDGPDGYGTFETTEVVVSAEVAGRLLRVAAEEGDRLPEGVTAAVVDTTQIALQIAELEAQRAAAGSRTGSASANVAALIAELDAARRELGRVRRLFDGQAATARQLDQAEAQVDVLERRIAAARSEQSGSEEQGEGIDAQVARLRDLLAKSHVRNPVAGTVLTRYVEAGEFVQPGAPLYRIADLDFLVLKAYVSGDQLAQLRLGETATVQYDIGDGEMGERSGRIRWIADEAEFTPTPIQTREERADLVYAVEVEVPNRDGALKIGMPGELVLPEADEG